MHPATPIVETELRELEFVFYEVSKAAICSWGKEYDLTGAEGLRDRQE